MNLPFIFFFHIRLVMTHCSSYPEISNQKKSFPLLLLSHDIGINYHCYSSLCQAIASNGFIVAVPQHEDFFSTGDTPALGSPTFLNPKIAQHKALQQIVSNPERRSPSRNLPIGEAQRDQKRKLLRERVKNMRDAYQYLKDLSQEEDGWLKEKIDWNMVTVVGHGVGGATALLCCLQNNQEQNIQFRIHNCILLSPCLGIFSEADFLSVVQSFISTNPAKEHDTDTDRSDFRHVLSDNEKGIYESKSYNAAAERLIQSFLIIIPSESVNRNVENLVPSLNLIYSGTRDQSPIFCISRSTHLDLCDIPLLSPSLFRFKGKSGPRNPKNTLQIQNSIVKHFLLRQYKKSMYDSAPPKLRKRPPGGGSPFEATISDSSVTGSRSIYKKEVSGEVADRALYMCYNERIKDPTPDDGIKEDKYGYSTLLEQLTMFGDHEDKKKPEEMVFLI
eukprot:GHVP01068828.1.p1 GENE.GHVP01068828.1~~GHVP01068828.1.p1  ORF type:complete len:446 (+),score=61.94 GHVP01068828.1:563-1900(+)